MLQLLLSSLILLGSVQRAGAQVPAVASVVAFLIANPFLVFYGWNPLALFPCGTFVPLTGFQLAPPWNGVTCAKMGFFGVYVNVIIGLYV